MMSLGKEQAMCTLSVIVKLMYGTSLYCILYIPLTDIVRVGVIQPHIVKQGRGHTTIKWNHKFLVVAERG